MWTATIKQIDKDSGTILVIFSDGERDRGEWISILGVDNTTLKNIIETKRVYYENSYSFIDTVDTDFLSTVSLTPTPVTVSDPVETAKADFRAIYSKRSRVNLGINLGFISLSDLSALDKDLQTKWATLVSLIGLDAAIDQI